MRKLTGITRCLHVPALLFDLIFQMLDAVLKLAQLTLEKAQKCVIKIAKEEQKHTTTKLLLIKHKNETQTL